MFYIDLKTGDMVKCNGRKSAEKVHLVEAVQQEFEFAFICDHKLFRIPENTLVVMTGDVSENNTIPMFVTEGYVSDDRKSVKFIVDTYTQEYLQRVKSSSTVCMIDITLTSPENTVSRLVRFTALADARIYVHDTPPRPVVEYYSKKEIDQLLKNVNATISFNQPQVTTATAAPGTDAAVQVDMTSDESASTLHFNFTIPRGEKGDPGEKGEKGEKGDPGDSGTGGGSAFIQPLADHIYYHAVYDSVCYLDADNSITAVGYHATPWNVVKLWVVPKDPAFSGSVVLYCGSNRLQTQVNTTLTELEWNLTAPVSGIISITRDTSDPADTLKNDSGNVVTLMVVDWRVM